MSSAAATPDQTPAAWLELGLSTGDRSWHRPVLFIFALSPRSLSLSHLML